MVAKNTTPNGEVRLVQNGKRWDLTITGQTERPILMIKNAWTVEDILTDGILRARNANYLKDETPVVIVDRAGTEHRGWKVSDLWMGKLKLEMYMGKEDSTQPEKEINDPS